MIPCKQLHRHDPKNGIYGDCHRTAIACILNVHPTVVPHFMAEDNDNWDKQTKDWLRTRGLWSISIPFQSTLEKVLETLEVLNPAVYGILGGKSKNNCGHSVVICGGKIVWDPSLDDSGIVGPMDDGLFWVTYFVPYHVVKE